MDRKSRQKKKTREIKYQSIIYNSKFYTMKMARKYIPQKIRCILFLEYFGLLDLKNCIFKFHMKKKQEYQTVLYSKRHKLVFYCFHFEAKFIDHNCLES